MNVKGLIFDLDGTLVDSLQDLTHAMNSALTKLGYPTHSIETYETLVGSGLKKLANDSLPESARDEDTVDKCHKLMLETYSINPVERTSPYKGISEMVTELCKKGLKLAVLSNKADEFTKRIVDTLFPKQFELIRGLTSEELKKPNPANTLGICKQLGLKPNEVYFVGDSEIDMQTANNANIKAVGVTWGYRSKEELLANGANYVIENPSELEKLLN